MLLSRTVLDSHYAVLLSVLAALALFFPQTSYLRANHRERKFLRNDPVACVSSEKASGEVKRGEDYDHMIVNSPSLTFRLRAVARGGWEIEILPKEPRGDGKRTDWAWPLNPPYHGYNSQNVSVSYGFTAKNVVEYGPREFRFPLNEADAKRALRLFDKIESSTGQQLDGAMQELDKFPSGKATFEILDSQLSSNSPGRIEWIKFQVSFVLPCQPAVKRQ